MGKIEIIAGQKFGVLTVIKEADKAILPCGQTNRMMLCRCDCGIEKTIRVSHLTRGLIISCGVCLYKGRHKREDRKLHNSWRGMRNRCKLDTYIDAHLYKEKGITVCEEWETFSVFKEWALNNGWKEGLSIDRIDSNKGYNPDNCRWADAITQANNINTNLIVSYNGEDRPISLVVHEKGLDKHYGAILGRIRRGWNAQNAIDTPIRKGNYHDRWLRSAS